ncbi:hypothetical protein [Salinisphaera sp. T31B1]|uniref:hypothetical protein n=1 Tax=Salinisphaera sp. T31B1 TaxID=727963 RepID=UPI00333EC81C
MKRLVNARHLAIPAVCLAAVVSGCAVQGGPVTEDGDDFAMIDSDAAFGYQQTDWSQPFWERWIAEARSGRPAEQADGRSSRAAPAIADTGAPSASASAGTAGVSASTASAVGASSALRPAIAVIVDPDDRNDPAAYELVSRIRQRAASRGMTVIASEIVYDAIAGSQPCRQADARACLQTLAVYPGVRLLIRASVEDSKDGEFATLSTRMIDTDFGMEYEPRAVKWRPGAGDDVSVPVERLLDAAQARLEVAPWFTHVFQNSGDAFYLSAGSAAGLQVGDELTVHDEGTLIRMGGGQSAVWQPGEGVGRVRVEQFLGDRVAIARLVSGRAPTPADRLTRAR